MLSGESESGEDYVLVSSELIVLDDLVLKVHDDGSGAISTFIGTSLSEAFFGSSGYLLLTSGLLLVFFFLLSSSFFLFQGPRVTTSMGRR